MNKIVDYFSLGGNNCMPEMYLRHPGFTYSACEPFPKNKERIQKFKETGDSRCIHQNKLDKVCFQHDMAYGDFEDLTRRTASDKILRDEAFDIAKFPNMMNIIVDIDSMVDLVTIVYKFLIKKLLVVALMANENISNKE